MTWSGVHGNPPIFSGGENVTGWVLANDPTLPAAVYKAPAPVALFGGQSRQLYVDGVRAARTSRPASAVLPGLDLESRPDCEACSYAVSSQDPQTWSNPQDVGAYVNGYATVRLPQNTTRGLYAFVHWPSPT